MLKNFLLSKASVLALTAIVLNSLVVPAWSMKRRGEEDQNSNSAKQSRTLTTPMNERNNGERNITSTQDKNTFPFQDLPLELKALILEMAAFDVGADKKSLSNLALVCKNWNDNIVKNEAYGINISIKKAFWRGVYNITNPQDIANFDRFYKGSLIYRPIEESDEGMIRLPISDLRNPLEGTFDLSQCGEAGQYLSIATGYRKGQTPANVNKVEIWFTPRFLVDKEMSQLASKHHIRKVIGNWDAAKAPIGIFWTSGRWNAKYDMQFCDYLTAESMDELRSENLLKKYQKSVVAILRWPGVHMCPWSYLFYPKVSHFICELK